VEYIRNDAIDANTFFANLNGQPKPELRYNTFGFNAGGPVPKIGHQKKTFFFYNQECAGRSRETRLTRLRIPRREER